MGFNSAFKGLIHKGVRRIQKNHISGEKILQSTCLSAIEEKKTQWLHVSAFSYFLHLTFISFFPSMYKDKSRCDIEGPEDGADEECFLVGCDAVYVGKQGRLYLPVSMTSRHGRNRFSATAKFMLRTPHFLKLLYVKI